MLRKSSVLKKLLKVGVVVLCVTGFFLQTFEFLDLYWTYPTVVDIQVTVPSEIEMPAISICSNNGIYPLAVCALGRFCTPPSYKINASGICDALPDICENEKPPPDFRAVTYQKMFMEYAVNTSLRDQMMVPLEEYFACNIVSDIDGRKCNTESAIIGSYYSDDNSPNFCYTLNSHWKNPKAKVEKIQKSEKIDIKIYIDCSFRNRNVELDYVQIPKYNCISSPSIQMAIHSRYLVASPFISGHGFLGGKKYLVKIKQNEKHLLPSPYQTNCTDYMPAWRARGGVGPLTQLMVIQECKLNATLKGLGCVPFFVDYPHDETICKYCKNCPEVTRIGSNCTELLRYYNQPCDYINYDMEVEETLVDIERFIRSPMLRTPESLTVMEKGYNCTYDKAFTKRCQTIHIEIVFDEFEITNVTYNPKYESLELFSVIGGYVGMYLGISIVAVYDFAEAAFKSLYSFLKKRGKEKKRSGRKKETQMDRSPYPDSRLRRASTASLYSNGFQKRSVISHPHRRVY